MRKYSEILKKYKTTAAKKAFMTREIKFQKNYIHDLEECAKSQIKNKSDRFFWFLGDRKSTFYIDDQKSELKLMENLRAKL